SYGVALHFMVGSMLCWGSWANTMKLCPGYRFQLFYWDYIVGLLVGIVFWGLTLGSIGPGPHFVSDIASAPALSIGLAILSGVLLGSFYPLVSKAMSLPDAPGPYATGLFFVIGTALCSLPVNTLFMKKPIDGGVAVNFGQYASAPGRWHLAGVLGGTIWVTGA